MKRTLLTFALLLSGSVFAHGGGHDDPNHYDPPVEIIDYCGFDLAQFDPALGCLASGADGQFYYLDDEWHWQAAPADPLFFDWNDVIWYEQEPEFLWWHPDSHNPGQSGEPEPETGPDNNGWQVMRCKPMTPGGKK